MARHFTPPDEVCDLCGAYVANKPQHVHWHSQLAPLLRVDVPDDLADTTRLPPITDTVRRRPPVPRVTELTGAQLVEALMAELERERNGGDEL